MERVSRFVFETISPSHMSYGNTDKQSEFHVLNVWTQTVRTLIVRTLTIDRSGSGSTGAAVAALEVGCSLLDLAARAVEMRLRQD